MEESLKPHIEALVKALKEDSGYRESWKANIAMAFKDQASFSFVSWVPKVVDEVANKAADHFLNQLCKEKSEELEPRHSPVLNKTGDELARLRQDNSTLHQEIETKEYYLSQAYIKIEALRALQEENQKLREKGEFLLKEMKIGSELGFSWSIAVERCRSEFEQALTPENKAPAGANHG